MNWKKIPDGRAGREQTVTASLVIETGRSGKIRIYPDNFPSDIGITLSVGTNVFVYQDDVNPSVFAVTETRNRTVRKIRNGGRKDKEGKYMEESPIMCISMIAKLSEKTT